MPKYENQLPVNAAFVNVGFEKMPYIITIRSNLTSQLKFIKLVSAGKIKDFSLKTFSLIKEMNKDGTITDVINANQSILVQVVKNQYLPRTKLALSFLPEDLLF
jgi:ribonuclease G